MTHPHWSIRALRVLLAAICVGIAGWYSPLLAAAGWHLFHPGGKVEYRGLHILVAWPWTVETWSDDREGDGFPQGLSLKKTPFTMDRRLSNESVFVTVISLDPGVTAEQQEERWMEMFRAAHPGAVFDMGTPAMGPTAARCLRAQSRWNQHSVVWTCISVREGWVADFEGNEPNAPAFFRMVGNLKR